jgi:hypothetical protein
MIRTRLLTRLMLAGMMSGAPLTVKAGFAQDVKPGNPPVKTTPFPDVATTHWAYPAVESLREKGILIGYPPAPRRTAIQVPARQGQGNSAGVAGPFVDQPVQHWRERIVDGLRVRGIQRGHPNQPTAAPRGARTARDRRR